VDAIRILGAGLSGLTTAILLARRGLAVEVRDRSLGGHGRFRGGFQVLENGSVERDCLAELAAIGLEPRCELIPLVTATFVDARRRVYEVKSAQPYAYMLRRGPGEGTLDTWLEAEARRAGVRIEPGSRSDDWLPEVVATGPACADGAARELVFRTDHPDLVVTLFDTALAPTGYAYLFVQHGWGTAGAAQVCGLGELRGNADRAIAELFRLYPMQRQNEHEHGQVMNFAIPRHLRHDNCWFVGEAAGVQDFLFGLGNRLAVRSAALVADALGGRGWDETRFRRDIVAPMRGSIAARFLYEHLGNGGLELLCRFFAGGDFRRRLLALQRPNPFRAAMTAVVMRAWRAGDAQRGSPVMAWARRAEGSGAPDLLGA